MGSCECDIYNLLLKVKWIVELEKLFDLFVMVSISDTPTIKYWHTFQKSMVCAKEEIPTECIIEDTRFTSFETI